MSIAYLTPTEFKARSVLPDQWVDEVAVSYPNFLTGQLLSYSSLIDSRLTKRYAVPFSNPTPEQVLIWLTNLVQPMVLLKRGIDPADEQVKTLFELQKNTLDDIKEAADATAGLYELPLRSDLPSSDGVVKGRIKCQSENTPYGAFDRQRNRVVGGNW